MKGDGVRLVEVGWVGGREVQMGVLSLKLKKLKKKITLEEPILDWKGCWWQETSPPLPKVNSDLQFHQPAFGNFLACGGVNVFSVRYCHP